MLSESARTFQILRQRKLDPRCPRTGLMRSFRLPFQEHYSAGLGVLTKIYLDELSTLEQLSDPNEQQKTMGRAEGWLVHTDVSGSFKRACELWDAVYESIKVADPALLSKEDKETWSQVDNWLSPRRLL